MINKKQSRLRRARATRARILLQKVDRLTVHRTNCTSTPASFRPTTVVRWFRPPRSNPKFALSSRAFPVVAATSLPRRSWVPASPRRRRLPVLSCAFDRSGYRFHGRVAALAEAAREAGLKF